MSGSNKFAPFTYDSLDPNQRQKLFGMFEESYRKETGQAWSQPKFESRAQNWHFYGDEDGFVAVRPQRSGMKKLVGVAGSPKSIIKGVDQLQQEGGPIWGAVSSPLAAMAKKRGLIVPHLHFGGPTLIKHVINNVPASVFGGVQPKVQPDGGIELDYPDVGKATKYLVVNKEYLKQLTGMPQVAQAIKGNKVVQTFMKLVGM